MGRLDGKVAIISGGARGQGAAEAKIFAREGASVVIGDILDEEGKKTEAEIAEAGGEITYVHLDVTVEEDWQKAVAEAEAKYGKLNVLVNNAGILFRAAIPNITVEQWDRIMDVNVKGVFLGTKYSIPAMRPGWRRFDNQHIVHGGPGGKPRRDCGVRGHQGRSPHLHKGHRRTARQRPDPRQLGPPRPREDRDDSRHPERPRKLPATAA